MPAVVSVFGVDPLRIGGTETFAQGVVTATGRRGRQSVLCFLSKPTPQVENFLDLPNISLEVLQILPSSVWPAPELSRSF